jgi:hypothetical protein|tara:strand:- start:692 stop:1288 length:597 start_codon:yes stop_codon:yes gene_type:complete
MIFTNSRTISKKNQQSVNYSISNLKPLPYDNKKLSNVNIQTSTTSNIPKILWGPSIWDLLHCLAEKIKNDSYSSLKTDIFFHIQSICNNLPCPSCSVHATQYLQKVDFSKLRTKEDFKMMLYNFHNVVNKRIGRPEYQFNELTMRYNNKDFYDVINSFFKFFENKHKTVNMLSNDIYTMRISKNIKSWLSANISHFGR